MRLARLGVVMTIPIAVAAAVFSAAGPARAGADTIEVTTTEDELTADGDCSLREAVVAANTNTAVDACPAGRPAAEGPDTIVLGAGQYVIAIPGADEDLALTGDLDLIEDTSVRGPLSNGVATIDGAGLDRIFDLRSGERVWSFVGLVLRNGDAGSGDGGAIRVGDGVCDAFGPTTNGNLGALTAENNHAARGGAIHIGTCNNPLFRGNSIVSNAADMEGGGVSAVGRTHLHVETSTISGNTAGVAGGGIWSDLETDVSLSFATVADNEAPDGGGIWSASPIQLLSPILALNGGANCGGPGVSYVGGLSDDDTCAGNVTDDAGLRPLTRIGPAVVHLLAPDSPAIELAGEPSASGNCGQLIDDQIGSIRPQDGDGDGVASCDAGAIEAPAVPLLAPSPSPQPLPNTATTGADTHARPLGMIALLLASCALVLVCRRRDGREARGG